MNVLMHEISFKNQEVVLFCSIIEVHIVHILQHDLAMFSNTNIQRKEI